MTNKEKLQQLYKTKEQMLKDRELYDSWSDMAKGLGISYDAMKDHKTALGIPKEKRGGAHGKKRNNFAVVTHSEMDKTIEKILNGKSENKVKVYKITNPEAFYSNPCGNDGLEFIGIENGTNWRTISHLIPSALSERGTV